jgi:Tol biopolymer transport system component
MVSTLTTRASAMRAAVIAMIPAFAACSEAPTALSARGADQLDGADAARACTRCDKPIVFDASPANNSFASHIYIVSPDGSGLTALTSGASWNAQPAWSSAYQQIVFVSDRHDLGKAPQIYTMTAKGDPVKRITYSDVIEHSPAYSPDGKKIAFVRHVAGTNKVVVINPDGTGEVVFPYAGSLAPSFSPDGQRVIFSSTMHSTAGAEEAREIYMANRDGTNLKRITTDGLYNHNPVWTPDGKKIVFESYRGNLDGIYKMNPDGSTIETLAKADVGSNDWFGWATVNAASTQVLFWTDMTGKDELRIVGINGGVSTVVPLPAHIEPGSASWSFAR